MTSRHLVYLFTAVFLSILPGSLTSQYIPAQVEISKVIESVDGERLYLHTVKEKQTLFSIARAYGVSTLAIAEANPEHPEIMKGINVDQVIRIPVIDKDRLSETSQPQLDTPPITKDTLWPVGLMYDLYPEYHDTDIQCLYPELKRSYNVALLIPLFLEATGDNFNKLPENHESFTFLPYYQGVLIAIDSIKKSGVDIYLHTFDLGREINKARQVTLKPEMKHMDLIIGPFYQETLPFVANFANKHRIPLVSPLIQSNDQLVDQPNIFQAIPSNQSQLRKLAEFLKNKYAGQNILLVHNNVVEVLPFINDFKLAAQHRPGDDLEKKETYGSGASNIYGYFINGSMVGASRAEQPPVATEPDGSFLSPRPLPLGDIIIKEIVVGQGSTTAARIISSLKKDRNNVIVSLIGNEVLMSNIMRELNLISNKNPLTRAGYDIILVGPEPWEEFRSIDLRLYESLNVHVFSSEFVDYTHPHIKNFVYKFREVFNDEPSNYAFWGAQTAYFFFNAIGVYGTSFPACINKINKTNNTSPFYFERHLSEKNGWANTQLILYRINDYRKQCVVRPFTGIDTEGF